MNNLNEQIVKDILELSNNKKKKANVEENEKHIETVYEIEEVQDLVDRKREYMLLPEVLAADFGNPDLYKVGAPGYNAKYDDINSGKGSTSQSE